MDAVKWENFFANLNMWKVLTNITDFVKWCLSSEQRDLIHFCHRRGSFTKMFFTEKVTRRCSVKKIFLKMSQNSLENTCARVTYRPATLFKKRLLHRSFPVNFDKCLSRTIPVAASVFNPSTMLFRSMEIERLHKMG